MNSLGFTRHCFLMPGPTFIPTRIHSMKYDYHSIEYLY
ncbi:hypothetical protein LEP1GSC068_0686 [Leptospira sp. Fiocruz LV3954]|nr:hypothetical protein LEP1GSC068_0686 [Leptospira sp. Fiocruz LV3954]EMI64992.1 hypothetical protein LEP1GSC076_0969 [Leptospira sp. Fiocruz LV4135]